MTYPGSPYPPPDPSLSAAPPASAYPAPFAYPPSMWPTHTFRSVGGLANGTLVCAGLATVCAVVGALIEPAKNPYSASFWIQTGILGLAGVALFVTYFFLVFWQMAVNANLAAQREETAHTWKIWLGWIIPIAALFLPLLVMNRLNVRNPVDSKWLALWWSGWIAAQVGNRDLLDYRGGAVTVSTFAGILLSIGALASFAGFYALIRGISRNHIAQVPTAAAPAWSAPSNVLPVYGPDGKPTWIAPPAQPHVGLADTPFPTDTTELLRRRF